MSAATDDSNGAKPAADGDETRVMPAEDDDQTRVMSAGYDQQETPPRLTEDDATQITSRGLERGDPGFTRPMPGLTDASVRARKDVSAELGSGKTIIKGRFVLEQLLGAGGMGSVYKAKDLRRVEAEDRNPWLAIKLLNEDFKSHPGAFMSLQRESRKSQDLTHPNIVQVFDFDRDDDTVFMTMELMKGDELSHYISNHPEGVELDEVLRLTREMGAALQHAHSHDITHADFKPGNVFVLENGTAKVLDFGIAQAVAHADLEEATDEKTAFDPGSLGALTPAYASLEMLHGMAPLPVDDVYALGCIVYQLLCGKHPYDKMPADEALAKGRQPEKIAKINRRQWRALQKALALKRENRCPSVAEFLDDFAPLANPWAKRLVWGVAATVLIVSGVYYIQQQAIANRDADTVVKNVSAALDRKVSNELRGLKEEEEILKDELSNLRENFKRNDENREIYLAKLEDLYQASAWRNLLNTQSLGEPLLSDWEDVRKSRPAKVSDLEAHRDDLVKEQEQDRNIENARVSNWIGDYQTTIVQQYIFEALEEGLKANFDEATEILGEARTALTGAGDIAAGLEKQLDSTEKRLEKIKADYVDKIASQKREARRVDEENERKRQELLYDEELIRLASMQLKFEVADSDLLANLEQCESTARSGAFGYDIDTFKSRFTTLKNDFANLSSRTVELEEDFRGLKEKATGALGGYIGQLGSCIQVYGLTDPSRAETEMASAIEAFPEYSSILAGLAIRPWDSCKPYLAGRGMQASYVCRDRFLGERNRKGPELVVIPTSKEKGIAEFAIGKYEISEQEINAWCSSTEGCQSAPSTRGDLPKTSIGLYQVAAYLDWLSDRTGFSYSLPSVQQWQYAARARADGDTSPAALDSARNCSLDERNVAKGKHLLPVQSGLQNDWGLVHHLGNARELVIDETGSGTWAAGGSHVDDMDYCTDDALDKLDEQGDAETGFRVLRAMLSNQ